MNKEEFFSLLADVENDYKNESRGKDPGELDALLLTTFQRHHMPNLPFIRAAIHNGGDSKIAFYATMERAWRQYAQDFILRVRASFDDFLNEGKINPDKISGFAERHNLSPGEAA